MTSNAQPTEGWRAAFPLVLLVGGVVLLLASFFLPSRMLGHGGWSTEDAKRYQAASVKLHTLSHTAVHAKPADQPQMRKDLAEAQSDYESIRKELDSAISGPRRTALTLRILGGLLLVSGGISAFLTRHHVES
jgi:hypothetical protein